MGGSYDQTSVEEKEENEKTEEEDVRHASPGVTIGQRLGASACLIFPFSAPACASLNAVNCLFMSRLNVAHGEPTALASKIESLTLYSGLQYCFFFSAVVASIIATLLFCAVILGWSIFLLSFLLPSHCRSSCRTRAMSKSESKRERERERDSS